MKKFANAAHWRLSLQALLVLLVACGSTQAPIRDQGRAFPNQQPEIVRDRGPVIFQPADAAAAIGRPGIHRVREGDTLYAIAFMYGVDYREIVTANNLSPPYTIYVDQELKLSTDAAGAVASAAAPGGSIQRQPIERRPSAPVASEQSPPVGGSSAGGWQWPLAERGSTNYRPDINNRLDIEAKAGDSVLAARDGEVVYSRPFGDDSGSLLIIRHDNRYLSAYTQTGRVLVDTGARVTAGQPIVELEPVDSGPVMVYFNVQRDGAFINPVNLLP